MLPLVHGGAKNLSPGWCSYPNRFGDSPEVELLCGGINSKTVEAVGLWRQGNLLHFGFEPDPSELNGAGQALLENSIHYIAHFQTDRPIARTPSVFVTGVSIPRRDALRTSVERALENGEDPRKALERSLTETELARLAELEPRAAGERFLAHVGKMRLVNEARLELDEDLVALGLSNDDPALLGMAIDALESPTDALAARRVLERYFPCGPEPSADTAAWRAFHEAHAPYLFFLETGLYRWYVDPLAKERGVPSADLRGRRRADEPR